MPTAATVENVVLPGELLMSAPGEVVEVFVTTKHSNVELHEALRICERPVGRTANCHPLIPLVVKSTWGWPVGEIPVVMHSAIVEHDTERTWPIPAGRVTGDDHFAPA